MIGLQRLFKMMDDDGSQSLSLPEFTKTCRDFKVGISDENVPILFSVFDSNGDGTLNYKEFIDAVREPLSESRRQLIEQVFNHIDVDGSGKLDIEEVKAKFDVHRHPEVIQGKRTAEIVLNEFISTLEANHNNINGLDSDGMVSLEEFVEYYTNVGSSIESDSEFSSTLKHTWGFKEEETDTISQRRTQQAAGARKAAEEQV